MPISAAILLAATAIAVYILVGYPILLAIVKWRQAPTVRKTLEFKTTVSVIIAVYNGAAFLRAKLDSLCNLNYPAELMQILIVSDGSTDDTDAIVESYPDSRVKLYRAPKGGKAAALNLALPHATGEIIFFTDVRQPLDRDSLAHLVANFADPTVGAVTGEMKLLKGDQGEHADMDLYWRYEIWARTQHSKIDSLFNTTGCIYAMRREIAAPVPPDTISDDAILPLRAFFQGYRVIFDPAAIAFDYPAVAGTEFRRRLRNLAGQWQVHARIPQLFGASNRMRFHFLSHKFARLVLPWMILVTFAATAALPAGSMRSSLLIGDGLFFLLALVDRFVPKGIFIKRLTSPARTFLAMNMAALAAILVFFVPSGRLWNPTRVSVHRDSTA